MVSISSSVGSRGVNARTNVEKIQSLLNNHLGNIGMAHPVVVDGLAGRQTVIAIVEFQSRVVGMLEPDGRVDPGGRTLRFLNRQLLKLEQLPLGIGYYSYPSRAQAKAGQFCTKKTLKSITNVAKTLDKLDLEIGIGDISVKSGGKMPGHMSHQRGVDVDIRPQRRDGKRTPVTINNEAGYSRPNTAQLVKALRAEPNLHLILFNDTRIPGVQSHRGHDNHLHVRFKE